MNFKTRYLSCFWWRFTFFLPLLLLRSLALNSDATLLISLKRSILGDPLSVLANWNFNDETPCSWRGVTCTQLGGYGGGGGWPDVLLLRVTALALPGSQLLGSIPDELGRIEHLRHLDLSSNFFNGSLPISIFNASELQVLSLSNNVISGGLPESVGGLKSLQLLNLSDNALAGNVPGNLTGLQNLTVVSLRSNYFTGNIPSNFSSVEVLDLSSNLLNGSLPANFGGWKLRYLNFSYNKISSPIPPEFAKRIPANATMDLSFNNLTGAIPQSLALLSQKTEAFAGNEDLCGKPLKHLCSIPSSLTTPPNVSATSSSSPAIAAIPKTIGSVPATPSPGAPNGTQTSQPQTSMKPITIAAIAVGDIAGIAILAVVILYVYHHRKQKDPDSKDPKNAEKKPPMGSQQDHQNPKKPSSVLFCLANKGEETSEATSSSDGEEHRDKSGATHGEENRESKKNGVLVTVDGETELELETLLKASAYILGASGGSIVYKAVLEDGTAFAVRRIGDGGVERLRDFETQVRAIAKLRHQNLVKIRGFFWGDDEKLIIYDYVSNGCLAGSIHRKPSSSCSSQSHLSFEVRLKIARGIARGLAFIHEKKHVHGNMKPSNILINADMEPLITDLGLDRLVSGSSSSKIVLASGSARNFGSHRSTPTREHQDGGGGGISSGSPAVSLASAYQAPESLKNLKPSPKWDVYSFGVILLELLSGRIMTEREVSQWSGVGSAAEDEGRMKKLTDAAIRGEVEGREEAVMGCFRLGFSCVCFVPQKRPTMKEALQVLEKISTTISFSSHAN